MKIVITQKDHKCEKCKKEIPRLSKTLVHMPNPYPHNLYGTRIYYHPNCGLAVIGELYSELEVIAEKEGVK